MVVSSSLTHPDLRTNQPTKHISSYPRNPVHKQERREECVQRISNEPPIDRPIDRLRYAAALSLALLVHTPYSDTSSQPQPHTPYPLIHPFVHHTLQYNVNTTRTSSSHTRAIFHCFFLLSRTHLARSHHLSLSHHAPNASPLRLRRRYRPRIHDGLGYSRGAVIWYAALLSLATARCAS